MEMKQWWKKNRETHLGTVIYVIGGFLAAIAFYAIIGTVLGTQTPIVSVFSGSMTHDGLNDQGEFVGHMPIVGAGIEDYWRMYGEWYDGNNISRAEFSSWPISSGFAKGDILVIVGTTEVEKGDVIVFNSGRYYYYPIIHRVIGVEENGYRTKGDHNAAQDNWLVAKENVYGKAVGVVPLLGWVKIIFHDLTGIA
jgi:signal peptidase I